MAGFGDEIAAMATGAPLDDFDTHLANFRAVLNANPHGWGNAPPAAAPDNSPPDDFDQHLANFRAVLNASPSPPAPRPVNALASSPQPKPVVNALSPGMAAVRLIGGAAANAPKQIMDQVPRSAGQAALDAVMFAVPETRVPILAANAFFNSTGEAGAGEANDRVKELQQTLRDAGYYKGPIDGVMGGGTSEANQRYQQDSIAKQKADAERGAAEASKAESERKRQELEQHAKERQAGEDRMRQMENDVPWESRLLRDYGPMVGTVLGIGAGAGTRAGMTRTFNRQSEEAADAANALVTGRNRSFETRVGGLNAFFQKGGADEIPFTAAPRARMGVKSNSDALSATELFPDSPAYSAYVKPRDGAAVGGSMAEAGFSYHMAQQARAEEDDAQRAVQADPSEANIQRLELTKNRAALWDLGMNFGRGAAGGYALSGSKLRYQNTRPDVAAAEAERLRLDATVNSKRRRP